MQDIRQALMGDEIILGDGAFGTMLQAQGLPPGVMPEQWNVDNPSAVQAVHRAYLEVGSQFVTTNTFGGNRLRLESVGLGGRVVELVRLGVELAREVVDGRAWVAGGIGPTGHLMEPYGTLSVAVAEEAYAEQAAALVEAGADFILIETMNDIEEACAAVRAAKKVSALPVFCTFAFNARGRTMMGLRPEDAARRVEEAGGEAVGANCGEGPQAVAAALQGMRGATKLPLIAQANAGVPKVGEHAQAVWDVSPEQMAEHVLNFISLGARIVGGCCGTGPGHIAAIAKALGRDADCRY
ncbi:MAG: homocysteine S-methyltransferase family protein [Chloroflexi bacterium]|nr:homocysteine S-methyltransferase family protein [Chloroflexota bacterium]